MNGPAPSRASVRRGAALALVAGALACGSGAEPGTLVAAASSLRAVMPEVVASRGGASPARSIAVTYGGSGILRRQVEAGAPVDLVVFAGTAPVEALVAEGLVDGDSRRVVARNRLVLIGAADAADLDFASLPRMADGERLAIGDPDTVPAGHYAREALVTLGIWDALEGRLVLAHDVAAVLAYVERGEVAAGIVYATDAALGRRIRVLDRSRIAGAPEPIVVAALTTEGRSDPEAISLLDRLSGPDGQAIFARRGFLGP